jgi:hypothetical protein
MATAKPIAVMGHALWAAFIVALNITLLPSCDARVLASPAQPVCDEQHIVTSGSIFLPLDFS